jgi:hypothetical protein
MPKRNDGIQAAGMKFWIMAGQAVLLLWTA